MPTPQRSMIPPYRRVICGRTRMGKTTYLRQRIIDRSPAYIIYDPDKEMSEYGTVVESIDDLVTVVQRGAWRIVYQPTDEIMGDPESQVIEFDEGICKLVATKLTGFQLCVDEIASVTRAGGSRTAKCPRWLTIIIKRRMKPPWNIGLTVTTQRMKDADVEFLTQAQETIMFAQNEADAVYVAEKIGIRTLTLNGETKKVVEWLQTLPPLHYIKWNHVLREPWFGKVDPKAGDPRGQA